MDLNPTESLWGEFCVAKVTKQRSKEDSAKIPAQVSANLVKTYSKHFTSVISHKTCNYIILTSTFVIDHLKLRIIYKSYNGINWVFFPILSHI